MSTNENNINQNVDLLEDLMDEWDGIWSIQSSFKKEEITKKTKLLWYLNLFLFILFILILGVYYFIVLTLKPIDSLNDYERYYVNFSKSLLKLVWNTSEFDISLSPSVASIALSSKINTFIKSPSVIFYDKLNFKDAFEKDSYSKISSSFNTYKRYTSLLAKYKFFPQELQNIVQDIRVLPILTTLNSIKLYVTDYVLIKSDLFSDKIFNFVYPRNIFSTRYSSIPQDILLSTLKEDIQYFQDKWAYIYLTTVYFNYMYNDDDLSKLFFNKRFIDTFKTRLNYTYKILHSFLPNVDKNQFIGDYVNLIKDVYQRTITLNKEFKTEQLPVDVKLLSYNPKTQKLTFSIKVMLSPEMVSKIDIVQLFSDVVTLLRESRLIIGKDIAYNNLRIKKLIKRVAGYKVTYFTAEQRFQTSVQPKIDIEVTDTKY